MLGDWEGTGPDGLPLSFTLTRARGRTSVGDLTVGDPLSCPGRFAPTLAFGYPQALYIGPGAPPVVHINWRPSEIRIRVGMGAPFSPEWDGSLLGPRLMTLSEPAPTNNPPGCGWNSKRLTWRVAPAKRTPVAPGQWTGTVSGPGGAGTVSVKVAPSGRFVEVFEVESPARAAAAEAPGSGRPPWGTSSPLTAPSRTPTDRPGSRVVLNREGR